MLLGGWTFPLWLSIAVDDLEKPKATGTDPPHGFGIWSSDCAPGHSAQSTKEREDKMSVTKPEKIQLISVDGTKTHDELKRQLLRSLKDAGIPVQMEPDSPYAEEFGLDPSIAPKLTDKQWVELEIGMGKV
jgi:hypothetical protein